MHAKRNGLQLFRNGGRFVDRINDEVHDDCFVIATGGVSHVYKPLTDKIHIADRLHTLKGLYYLGKDL